MAQKFITNSARETQKLGERLALQLRSGQAREILLQSPPAGGAVVFGLQGDLGGGKTTFLQGFAKGLGIKEKILSPTFVILKRFQLPSLRARRRSNLDDRLLRRSAPRNDDAFTNFYHFDCYRIDKPQEILELNFKEIISNPENIVVIEWPEKIYPVKSAKGGVSPKAKQFNRVKILLPKNMIKIKFKFIHPESNRRVDQNKREIFLYKNKS